MKKMKLLIITHEFPPNVTSGSGVHITELVEELVKNKHDVTVITTDEKEGKKYESTGNLEIYRISIFKSAFLDKIIPNFLDHRILLGLKLKKFIKKINLEEYDLIHINDSKISYFLNKEIIKKVPAVISVNDYYAYESSWNPFKLPYFSTDFLLRYVYYNMIRILDGKFLKLANMLMTNTKYTANSIHMTFNIPKNKIAVIYRGIDIDKFQYTPKKNKYTNHKILFIGKNMERKGAIYIIKAFPKILDKFPDSKLTLIGRPTFLYKRKIMKYAEQHKLIKNMTIIYSVEQREAPNLFKESNVFVFPPIIENLARTLYEAQATKTPIVTTKVGANPEGVSNKGAILVDAKKEDQIADAVISIFSDPKKAETMGKDGFKRVKYLFNKKIMLNNTLHLYHAVIDK